MSEIKLVDVFILIISTMVEKNYLKKISGQTAKFARSSIS